MSETKTYTDSQATDEALLLFTRKMRRALDSETFNDIWGRLPQGARAAIYTSERRADMLREDGNTYSYQVDEMDDDETGEE